MPSYPQAVKDRAFQLYCEGRSLVKLREILRAEHPTLSKTTLENWQDKDDWRSRREGVKALARELVDSRQAETQARMVAKVDGLIDKVLGDELSGLEWKSKEGAVYGLSALVKTRERLTARPNAKLPDNLGANRVVKTLFSIILRHPVLGPVLEMHKQEIVMEISRELEAI